MRWLLRWWHRRQRKVDLEILWPQCLKHAPDLAHAKAAFAVHVLNDPAWTDEFSQRELLEYIDELHDDNVFRAQRDRPIEEGE